MSNKWRPTVSDILTIVALVVAVIMWFVQPTWEIGIPITVVTIAVVIFAALRHQSHPLIRIPIACVVVVILIAVVWRPIWNSFHKDYPRAAFNWPVTLNPPAVAPTPPAEPSDMPPLNLPGPPLSKWGNVMFICPQPAAVDPNKREEIKAQIRRNAEIYGKALGLDLVLSEIPYGIRFDVTARDTEGNQKLGMAQRYSVRMEATSYGIFLVFNIDFIGAFGILSGLPLERNSEMAKMWATQTEQMGFAHGACRML